MYLFLKFYLPVKVLEQTHVGFALASRTQVSLLKQYGIILLH
jgi:hypothetical protein